MIHHLVLYLFPEGIYLMNAKMNPVFSEDKMEGFSSFFTAMRVFSIEILERNPDFLEALVINKLSVRIVPLREIGCDYALIYRNTDDIDLKHFIMGISNLILAHRNIAKLVKKIRKTNEVSLIRSIVAPIELCIKEFNDAITQA